MRDALNTFFDGTVAQATPEKSTVRKVSYAEGIDGVQNMGPVDIGNGLNGDAYLAVGVKFGTFIPGDGTHATVTVGWFTADTDVDVVVAGKPIGTGILELDDGQHGRLPVPPGVGNYLGLQISVGNGTNGQTVDVYAGIEGF